MQAFLAKLHLATGDRKWLELAKEFQANAALSRPTVRSVILVHP